jgi:hypothetical protein
MEIPSNKMLTIDLTAGPPWQQFVATASKLWRHFFNSPEKERFIKLKFFSY